MVHADFPGAVVIAEESTAWPMVSRPTDVGGLGFSMKWNMGWMHDTLAYFRRDPVHRHHHHNELTFGQLYAYSENYVLPFSHDEVVHLKGSMLGKMAGDRWQKLANLRALLVYQMTYPGKKLNFMGNELATPDEWSVAWELAWGLLADPAHAGVQALLRDLNRLYVGQPELHELDFERDGFRWLEVNDAAHSTLSYARFDRRGRCVVVALNFTPVPRPASRLGVPVAGSYVELLNSDSRHYGGTDMGNLGSVESEPVEWNGMPRSIRVTLPPLAGIVLATKAA
jgi:1,4-alpha-glucan branching enzyme